MRFVFSVINFVHAVPVEERNFLLAVDERNSSCRSFCRAMFSNVASATKKIVRSENDQQSHENLFVDAKFYLAKQRSSTIESICTLSEVQRILPKKT